MTSRTAAYWPRWVAAICLTLGTVVLVTSEGCRPRATALDTTPRPGESTGTISGIVAGPEGINVIAGRTVNAINVETGERHRETTGATGSFTFKLRPGRYRVNVALLPGESVIKAPGVLNVDRADLDTRIDVIVGARASRPSHSSHPTDPSLGSPIA